MNRILLCLACWGLSLTAFSQKVYFIYIQSESGQPFFLRMNEKLYSSAASGYLIMPRLRDSTYQFAIGFPGNKWPDQSFTVTIDKKDQGYLLKNFEDKGWGLFNLQTLAVQMSSTPVAKKEMTATVENKEATEFTNILSKAADDPSLKEKPVPVKAPEPVGVVEKTPVAKENVPVTTVPETAMKEEPQTPPPTAPVKEPMPVPVPQDTGLAVAVQTDKKPAPVKEEPPTVVPVTTGKEVPDLTSPKDTILKAPAPVTDTKEKENVPVEVQVVKEEKPAAYKPAVVTKKSESSTTEGFGLTFTDEYEGQSDTIRILIPPPKPVVVPAVPKEEPKEERKFLETVTEDTLTKKTEKQPVVVTNPCPSVADDNDFLKLRKRMAAETTDEGMITEARKVLRTRCFSTTQIRNLGLLFLNDEGKYRFFDMAYPFVSDPGQYATLESELKDPYYINRFKAMLRL